MRMNRISPGFTLIELIIAVAIIGILAAIAYPSYTEHVRSSHRADAEGALYSWQQAMERLFTTQSSYESAVAGTIFSAQVPLSGGTPTYNLAFAPGSPTATAYTLWAVPTGPQASDRCGTLTLDSTNQRGILNPSPASLTVTDCWRN